MKSTNDVIKALMKNPKKMMDLIKKVGGKLSQKMDSGELSHDDILKEASSLFSHMKNMGGKNDLGALFKNMAKQMGGGAGSGAKVDMNAFSNKMKAQSFKEKMKERLEKKKAASAASNDNGYIYKNENNYVFSTNEKQEKTNVEDFTKLMSSYQDNNNNNIDILKSEENNSSTTNKKNNNKKKNNKKNK
jgi:hypothetical protein